MTTQKPKIWFPAKKYGWGWGFPSAWQGWVVILVYVALVAAASVLLNPALRMMSWLAAIGGLSVLLCLVCWWRGESPAWRWGDKQRESPTSPADRTT